MTEGSIAAKILQEGSDELLDPRVELATRREADQAVLTVTDDGFGIPHGGSVRAHSEGEGRGSRLTVRLPLVRGAGVEPPPEPPPARAGDARRRSGEGARPAVLVVEDNEDAREMLALLLAGRGYPVGTAADGPEGVAKGSSGDWDVAVVDIGLPGFDGYQVAQRLRAAEGGEDLVLIALSGYGRPEDRAHSRESGFDRHLVKPVEPQRLFDLLEQVETVRRRR